MDDLILHEDAEVTACGFLVDGRLWVVSPWAPQARMPVEGGQVEVDVAETLPASPHAVVRVIGRWREGRIAEATARGVETPDAGHWKSPPKDVLPSGLGAERFIEFSGWLRERSGAPVLGSGGSGVSMAISVLHVTAELAEAVEQLPVACEIWAAITPIAAPRSTGHSVGIHRLPDEGRSER